MECKRWDQYRAERGAWENMGQREAHERTWGRGRSKKEHGTERDGGALIDMGEVH